MPEISYIRLDAYGSYVWEQMDGKRDVMALACLMKERFGAKAEPLYERLIRFLETLKENKYIHLEKNEAEIQKADCGPKQRCHEV
nr:PqqD family protein [Eubacterium sp. 1001713B170207_170306_E7]